MRIVGLVGVGVVTKFDVPFAHKFTAHQNLHSPSQSSTGSVLEITCERRLFSFLDPFWCKMLPMNFVNTV